MANIKINELQPLEFEFEELSDLELEAIVGGKNARDPNRSSRRNRNSSRNWESYPSSILKVV
jgi:bacteriocin-like protein